MLCSPRRTDRRRRRQHYFLFAENNWCDTNMLLMHADFFFNIFFLAKIYIRQAFRIDFTQQRRRAARSIHEHNMRTWLAWLWWWCDGKGMRFDPKQSS